MEAEKTKRIGKYEIEIVRDLNPDSPRDWDNLGIYPEDEYMSKLHRDLISAFGEDKFKGIINDTASV